MPTVLRTGQYRVFYSDEREEPAHVHIELAERRAKFWLVPLELAWNEGFRSGELTEVKRIIEQDAGRIIREWNDYFGV